MLSLVPQNDFDALAAALTAANLPADDVRAPGRRFFRALNAVGETMGFGGIEGEGRDRLLRSVVIVEAARGKGWGGTLVASLLAEAKDSGAERLWLLTIDAADFFRRLGFQTAIRETAPSAITQSQQFSSLCPASAHLLVKTL